MSDENHRPSLGKLTPLSIKIGVECPGTSGVRTQNLSVDWLVFTVVTTYTPRPPRPSNHSNFNIYVPLISYICYLTTVV